ncbi:MAG: hypothetical protein H7Z76_04940, partial [Methylotenera sp.]|nr:hypothetical protein [Flavobacterium sp.]
KEQQLVNANKELMNIYEQKIKDRIAKVWGAPKEAIAKEEVLEEEVGNIAAEPEANYDLKI